MRRLALIEHIIESRLLEAWGRLTGDAAAHAFARRERLSAETHLWLLSARERALAARHTRPAYLNV